MKKSPHSAFIEPREAEVLFWVAQEKMNSEIALILGVKKHLEHIFEKLGVENRQSAALQALGALGER